MEGSPRRFAAAQSGAFAAYCVSCAAMIWVSLAAFLGVLGVGALSAWMPPLWSLWWGIGILVLIGSVGVLSWSVRHEPWWLPTLALAGGLLALLSMFTMPSGDSMSSMDGTDSGAASVGPMPVTYLLFWSATGALLAVVVVSSYRRRSRLPRREKPPLVGSD